MGSIADSDAVHDSRRILPQHQAALTLLTGRLQDPDIKSLLWLDLACGKGQIISQLKKNIPSEYRKKLSYWGYDINVDYTRIASRMADSLDFNCFEFAHGDFCNFSTIIDSKIKFDFVTCTNTAHEIKRGEFATTLLDSLIRLSDNGVLFIYDMESLVNLELGALPWTMSEIRNILNIIFETIGDEFRTVVLNTEHSSCDAWTVSINRNHIKTPNEKIIECKKEITKKMDDEISNILDIRLLESDKILKSFSLYGSKTADDEKVKLSALYDYWAINNAMENRK